VHGCEPRVAGARAVVALGLQMAEERRDQRRVEVLERQP